MTFITKYLRNKVDLILKLLGLGSSGCRTLLFGMDCGYKSRYKTAV